MADFEQTRPDDICVGIGSEALWDSFNYYVRDKISCRPSLAELALMPPPRTLYLIASPQSAWDQFNQALSEMEQSMTLVDHRKIGRIDIYRFDPKSTNPALTVQP